MPSRPLAILLLLAAAFTAEAHAAKKCRVDLEPMLRVHLDRQVRLRTIFFPPPANRIVHDLLVSRGGATSLMLTEESLCGPQCGAEPVRQFVAGRATAAQLAPLVAFFGSVEVGTSPACLIANDYSQPTGVVSHGSMEVEWFGNPGPIRLFTVFWGDAESFSGVPECGDGERQLLALFSAFEQGTRGGGLKPLQCPLP